MGINTAGFLKLILQTSFASELITSISFKFRADRSYWNCNLFVSVKRHRCEWWYRSSWHAVLDCILYRSNSVSFPSHPLFMICGDRERKLLGFRSFYSLHLGFWLHLGEFRLQLNNSFRIQFTYQHSRINILYFIGQVWSVLMGIPVKNLSAGGNLLWRFYSTTSLGVFSKAFWVVVFFFFPRK